MLSSEFFWMTSDTLPSIVLVVVWWVLMRSVRNTGYGIAVLGIAGTWLHEMMHLMYGFLLGAKPVSFSLWPKRVGNTWIFGSVGFTGLNIWNSGFVAFAPLTLAPVGVVLYQGWLLSAFFEGRYFEWLGASYVVACCFFSCIPSRTDVRVGGGSALMYVLIGFCVWKATH